MLQLLRQNSPRVSVKSPFAISIAIAPFQQTLSRAASTSKDRPATAAINKDFADKKSTHLDRDKVYGQSAEYSGSGTDDAVAARQDVAFDTAESASLDPEQAREMAGKGGVDVNPLEVSPANREVSETSREIESGAGEYVEINKETKTYKSTKSAGGKMGEGGAKKVHKGFDFRKEKETIIKPGSR